MFKSLSWLRIVLVLVVAVALCVGLASATHANPQPDPTSAASVRGTTRVMSGNLVQHGGQIVTTTNTVYTIFWMPNTYTVSSQYQSLVNSFLTNVAADSGKTTNVYYSLSQYTDSQGNHAKYSVVFGGSVIDTSPFPANGCTSSFASICLTDSQLQTEVSNVLARQGWGSASNKVYFLLTPQNVTTCFDSAGIYCSFRDYCAYHSSTPTNAIYSLIAYPTIASSKCGSFQTPNGDSAADSAINLISHEHNELITDPFHTAWYDASATKAERGDKCAWNFGTALGWTTQGGKYNQVINGQKYWLQAEWSNQSSGCVLTGL